MEVFLKKTTAGLPNWAWLLVVVGGAGVGFLFVRSQQANTANTTTTNTAASAASTNVGSTPQPDSGQQTPPNYDIGSGSNGQSPVYVVSSPIVPAASSIQQSTPQPSVNIRLQSLSGCSAAYDKSHSGVPLHSVPAGGNTIIGTIPFGASSIPLTGTEVTGSNQGGPCSQTNFWYPVSYNGLQGFVSSQDVSGLG